MSNQSIIDEEGKRIIPLWYAIDMDNASPEDKEEIQCIRDFEIIDLRRRGARSKVEMSAIISDARKFLKRLNSPINSCTVNQAKWHPFIRHLLSLCWTFLGSQYQAWRNADKAVKAVSKMQTLHSGITFGGHAWLRIHDRIKTQEIVSHKKLISYLEENPSKSVDELPMLETSEDEFSSGEEEEEEEFFRHKDSVDNHGGDGIVEGFEGLGIIDEEEVTQHDRPTTPVSYPSTNSRSFQSSSLRSSTGTSANITSADEGEKKE